MKHLPARIKLFCRLTPVILILTPEPIWGQISSEPLRSEPSAQPILDVGIRLQKSVNFYAENGIVVQYTNPHLLSGRLYIGASYVTSRLGTALHANAIKQDNFLVSVTYLFRPNWLIQPLVKANAGYFRADYGSALFGELPHSSPLVSSELGLCYCPRFPLKIIGSVGYNLLTGNGISGPGTLYPVFVQTSVSWNILKKSTNGQ